MGGSHGTAVGNHDEVGSGKTLDHRGRGGREGRPVDHLGRRNFAGGEVGRGVATVDIHRAVKARKGHPLGCLYQKPGHHVDELGPKEGTRCLVGCGRTWRLELMVGRRVSHEGRTHCSEILDRLEDHERRHYGNLVH